MVSSISSKSAIVRYRSECCYEHSFSITERSIPSPAVVTPGIQNFRRPQHATHRTNYAMD
jgi:hypothetical protein